MSRVFAAGFFVAAPVPPAAYRDKLNPGFNILTPDPDWTGIPARPGDKFTLQNESQLAVVPGA